MEECLLGDLTPCQVDRHDHHSEWGGVGAGRKICGPGLNKPGQNWNKTLEGEDTLELDGSDNCTAM